MKTSKKQKIINIVGRFCIMMIMICGLFIISSCTGKPSKEDSGLNVPKKEFPTTVAPTSQKVTIDSENTKKQIVCPALDSQLTQLALADDPVSLSAQMGLKSQQDSIQVLILLSGEDSSFLSDYKIQIGTQVGSKIQAIVPFDQLCELSKNENILSIRLSAQAVQ